LKDKEGQAEIHHDLGYLYYSRYRNYRKALEHLEASLKIHTEMDDESKILSDYNAIISIYNETNLDKAVEYSIAALKNISEDLIERAEKRLAPERQAPYHHPRWHSPLSPL
jgi:tetratricopeptide (TPR) repeat protein